MRTLNFTGLFHGRLTAEPVKILRIRFFLLRHRVSNTKLSLFPSLALKMRTVQNSIKNGHFRHSNTSTADLSVFTLSQKSILVSVIRICTRETEPGLRRSPLPPFTGLMKAVVSAMCNSKEARLQLLAYVVRLLFSFP